MKIEIYVGVMLVCYLTIAVAQLAKAKYKIPITIIGSIVFVAFAVPVLNYTIEQNKDSEYCGYIVEPPYETKAGYKVYPDCRIIFYNEKLKRNIDVKVNRQTFSNARVGKFVCFDLSPRQLEE